VSSAVPHRRPLPSIEHQGVTPELVVLVHGAPDRAASFNRVLPLLEDLSVVVYDRRGYGPAASSGQPGLTIAEHAVDLLAVLDGRTATVVGHSFGANVAIAAAVAEPRLIASLGLWEPPMPWMDWWPDATFREEVAVLASERDVDDLGERYPRLGMGEQRWGRLSPTRKAAFRAEGAALRSDMNSQLTIPFSLDDLRAPVVVGCGTPPSRRYGIGAQLLASAIGADLVLVPGAPHLCHADQPEAFARLVRHAVAARSGVPPPGGDGPGPSEGSVRFTVEVAGDGRSAEAPGA
jgi:pimeloyl-ACP methyl ester carboxylesterase